MIDVFYDSKCPVCKHQMQFYKKKDVKKLLNWQDLNKNTQKLQKYNISLLSALKVLHVIDNKGMIYKETDALIIIWQNISGFKYWAKLASFKPVKILIKLAYLVFAKSRFKVLGHCKAALKNDKVTF